EFENCRGFIHRHLFYKLDDLRAGKSLVRRRASPRIQHNDVARSRGLKLDNIGEDVRRKLRGLHLDIRWRRGLLQLEDIDLLFLTVFEQGKIGRLKICDGLAFFVGGDHIKYHNTGIDLDRRGYPVALRKLRRLLRRPALQLGSLSRLTPGNRTHQREQTNSNYNQEYCTVKLAHGGLLKPTLIL